MTDANDLIRYLKVTAGETPFLIREPDEISLTPEQEEHFIEGIVKEPRELMLIGTVAGEPVSYTHLVVSNKILLRIRQDLYEHIQTLSFSFFDSRPTGKILARIIGDVNSLRDVLVNVVTTLIPELITVIGLSLIHI